MPKKIIFICIDAGGPEYIEQSDTPNIDRMIASGLYLKGQAVIPSVTNVNNVSIITGSPPSVHGITSNYYYDRERGEGVYMESHEFLLKETVLQRAKRAGLSTALLTSKDKLKDMLSRDVDTVISGQSPPDWLIQRVGPAEDIYSAEINIWLFRALKEVLAEKDPDVVYVSTTDYIMHKHPPEDEESQYHMNSIDELLGDILNDYDAQIFLTADHGMSEKRIAIDVERILKRRGIAAEAVPIIKDRYVVHHNNQGGSIYVYLNERHISQATDALRESEGIEEVFERDDAASRFNLHRERIGDLFLLAGKDYVFGTLDEPMQNVDLRSHGSRYESTVPIICYGCTEQKRYEHNFDITKPCVSELLGSFIREMT